MPACARYLRNILSNKAKLNDFGNVPMNAECSAVLRNTLPPKLSDFGGVTIPCVIGNCEFQKVLCDLGSAVNLLLYDVYKKLEIGDLYKTSLTLQMAVGSIKRPIGMVENVLVIVDKFYFPADFVVLEMEKGYTTLILLGRKLLDTADTMIGVRRMEVSMGVEGERVTFQNGRVKEEPREHVTSCFSLKLFQYSRAEPKSRAKGGHPLNVTYHVEEPDKIAISHPLEASVQKSNIGELRKTYMTLQLADRSIKRPIQIVDKHLHQGR